MSFSGIISAKNFGRLCGVSLSKETSRRRTFLGAVVPVKVRGRSDAIAHWPEKMAS